jgi:hypothetical protein
MWLVCQVCLSGKIDASFMFSNYKSRYESELFEKPSWGCGLGPVKWANRHAANSVPAQKLEGLWFPVKPISELISWTRIANLTSILSFMMRISAL